MIYKRKVEFTSLGVTLIFAANQSHIDVKKNNKPTKWPKDPTNKFKERGYVSKFSLVDTSKKDPRDETEVKLTIEVRYKKDRVNQAKNGTLELGIHNGTKWLKPNPKVKYTIDDRSQKWNGSYEIEVTLPADPVVAWGP